MSYLIKLGKFIYSLYYDICIVLRLKKHKLVGKTVKVIELNSVIYVNITEVSKDGKFIFGEDYFPFYTKDIVKIYTDIELEIKKHYV